MIGVLFLLATLAAVMIIGGTLFLLNGGACRHKHPIPFRIHKHDPIHVYGWYCTNCDQTFDHHPREE